MFITTTKIKLPKILKTILIELNSLSYLPLIVGGCVRDNLLKKETRDYDIEVFNLESLNILENILKKYSNVNLIGKKFCVLNIKYKKYNFDFSLPRIEQKIGPKHTDYIVKIIPDTNYKKAALRRDITINSIAYNFLTNKLIDPFNGILDLKNKKIKKINDLTFIEDSLRVYRCIQLASRYEFEIERKTKELCKKIVANPEFNKLSKERIFEEYKKLFLKSDKPSIGLKLLKEFNILNINNNIENIDKLAKVLKNKKYNDNRKLYIFFACLFRMLEKNEAIFFLNSVTNDKSFLKNVINLANSEFSSNISSLKKLSLHIKLEDYITLNLAFDKILSLTKYEYLKKINILNKPLKNKITGKDLIGMGYKPSSKFKDILSFSLNLQINKNASKNILKKQILKKYKI